MGTVSAVQRKASVKVALYGLQGFDRQLDRYTPPAYLNILFFKLTMKILYYSWTTLLFLWLDEGLYR